MSSFSQLNSLHHKCKIHKSDIGGLCLDMSCHTASQMQCIKCISENTSCIRSRKHRFVTIEEFFNSFFNDYYYSLKNSFTTAKHVRLTEDLCRNTSNIISSFAQKRENILNAFNENFNELISKLQQQKNSFLEEYNKMMDEKLSELKEKLLTLNQMINFDSLDGYNEEHLVHSVLKMPYESLDKTFVFMKKAITNLSNKSNIKVNIEVKKIDNMHSDVLINRITNSFQKMNSEISELFSQIKKTMNTELFTDEIKETKRISDMKLIYDEHIDYSTNSNFINKKFIIYKSIIDRKFYLAYPTTLNAIKIECFDKEVRNDKEFLNATSNEVLHLDTNVNKRDHLMLAKLVGHLSTISFIRYFGDEKKEEEFIISTSKDHSIRIWSIGDIANFANKKEIFIINDNSNKVKTIMFPSIITSSDIFNDINTSLNFLIAVSQNDKIKIYDLNSGEHMRDLFDRTTPYKNTYETLVKNISISNENYIISSSSTTKVIKLWSFDTSKVIALIENYINIQHINIIDILYYKSKNKILIIDDIGEGTVLNITSTENKISFNAISMELKYENNERVGAFFISDDVLVIYSKDGMIFEYDLEEMKLYSKRRILHGLISYSMCCDESDLVICCHCEDQKLKLFK